MNRRLRKAHFTLVAILAPIAATILVTSVAIRKSIPLNAPPAALLEPAPAMQETGRRLVKAEGFDVEVRGLMDSSGKRFIEITPLRQPHIPDLMAYVGPGKTEAFDDSVRLLGQVYASCPVRYPLPVDSTQTLSELYFYSLATRTVVGRVNLADTVRVAP